MKQFFGILGVIFGGLGLALALTQIIGVWVVSPSIKQGLQSTAHSLQQGLTASDQSLTTVEMVISDLRSELQAGDGDWQPVQDKYAETLSQIRATVDAAGSIISLLQEVVGAARAVPRLAESLNLPAEPTQDLEKTGEVLERLSQVLAEMEANSGNLEEAGQQLITQFDTRLGRLHTDVKNLITAVTRTQASLTQLEANIPLLVNLSAGVITFLGIWFGLAQYCLLIYSWGWVKGAKPQPAPAEADIPNNQPDHVSLS
ncbi:MAG TPA: hypothetical protein PKD98_30035 [Anaerolineae bacterium]|nr:hypothetical protein [Anaerolineae bacterium]